jgi:hypothetical protein
MPDNTPNQPAAPAAQPTKPNQPPPNPANPNSVAGQGGVGGAGNPQNLNNSPSPGGDGVQSAASEKAAGGDDGVNQPKQQRINAAERREKTGTDDKGKPRRHALIQAPGEVLPFEQTNNTIFSPEEVAEADRQAIESNLPASTIAEMQGGRAALEAAKGKKFNENARVEPVAAKPANPVDATNKPADTDPAAKSAV